MGGRGASYGESLSGKKYRTEYKSYGQTGNIKIVKYKDAEEAKAPLETMANNRIYATLDANNNIKYITFYNADGTKRKQIDLYGKPHKKIKPPHTHLGYEHSEDGFRDITEKELEVIIRAEEFWKKRRKKLGL